MTSVISPISKDLCDIPNIKRTGTFFVIRPDSGLGPMEAILNP